MNYPFWLFFNENNDDINYLYSTIGKSLMICTRFERYCKNLELLLKFKTEKNKFDDEYLNQLANKIYSYTLYKNINNLFETKENDFRNILIEAKNIRNEIAHEITLGLDTPDLEYDEIIKLLELIKEKIEIVIKAEYNIILIISILTNDVKPTSNYIKDNINWIFYNDKI